MTTGSDTTTATSPDEIRSGSESDYIFFWDHVVSPSNPYSLAVFSQWYPLSFVDPSYPFPSSPPSPSPSPSSTPSSTSVNTSSNRAFPVDPTPFTPRESPTFKTAEHYMMYAKALLFDPSRAPDILQSPTPAEAQRLGRQLRGFKREIWDLYNDDIVQRANYLKFGQDGDGLALGTLLDTGGGMTGGQEQVEDTVKDEDEETDGKGNGNGKGERSEAKAKAKRKGNELIEASPKDRIWGIGYGKEEAWEHRHEWGANRMGKALMRARDILLNEHRDKHKHKHRHEAKNDDIGKDL